MDGSEIDDWHEQLTGQIKELEARGGGTLELADGVYEITKPLRLPVSVSLVMTPYAVIRARRGFQGDAVIVKGGGKSSKFCYHGGWIRGGVIDGNRLPLTGLRVESGVARMEIADLEVLNALHKGIHVLGSGYETNLTRVRCDVELNTRYAPQSIGIHFEKGDCKVILAHVIGYETGLRSDASSNWFTMIHVWNSDDTQGPMKYCFYCNGGNNTFNQCYADSPTIAGFYITKPHQSMVQCRVYYSRWAKDNSGAGFLITPEGKHGSYLGNVLFGNNEHRLAEAFSGELDGACILGTSSWGVVGGLENRIPSGSSVDYPPLNIVGSGVRLTPQATPPLSDQGVVGELRWVDDGTASALWVKTARGWKKSELV
ncbi:MAG: hypothetical protein P4N24_21855 [Acidobacteriota bacterium]|nr:hypothetical protein [Acidobacteriota bacterium]